MLRDDFCRWPQGSRSCEVVHGIFQGPSEEIYHIQSQIPLHATTKACKKEDLSEPRNTLDANGFQLEIDTMWASKGHNVKLTIDI